MTEPHLTDINQCIQNDIFHLLQQDIIEDTSSTKLVCIYLNFIIDTLVEAPIKSMMVNNKGATEVLERLLWLLLRCMQLSNQLVTKISTGNLNFLTETIIIENDSGSVRYTARKTWKVIHCLFGAKVVDAMESIIHTYVAERTDENWWKVLEACLYCLSEDYKGFNNLVEGFLNTNVLQNLSNTGKNKIITVQNFNVLL